MIRICLIFMLSFNALSIKESYAQNQIIQELEKKTKEGELLSSLKLAQLYIKDYATDNHIIQAYGFLKTIVKEKAESHPYTSDGRMVGLSYLELGKLYLNGKAPNIKTPDFTRAFDFFQQAAIFYGDVEAQYQLAKLYLKAPNGVTYDAKQAMRWLTLAASKSHPEAQAELGYILFQGKLIPRNAALGLMYLTLAQDGVVDNISIKDRYNESMANASDIEREKALALVERWVGSDK